MTSLLIISTLLTNMHCIMGFVSSKIWCISKSIAFLSLCTCIINRCGSENILFLAVLYKAIIRNKTIFLNNVHVAFCMFSDKDRRHKGIYWPQWLAASSKYTNGQWVWYVNDREISMWDTPTYWDYSEPQGRTCLTFTTGKFSFNKNWNRWKSYNCAIKRPFLCQIRL